MDDLSGGPIGSPGLVDRVKGILLKPNEEWPKIDAEPATIPEIYRGYVVLLAAIGPICGLVGALAFGYSFLGITYRPSVGSALTSAVLQYVMALIMVYVLAVIIDVLAPSFAGTSNRVQAFKVAAYAMTAGWVAGVLGLLPSIAMLALLAGLYGLYLLYLGLPRLMKVPQDKAVGYTAVVIIVAIVVFVILGAITGLVTRSIVGVPNLGTIADRGQISGTMSLPGVGSVDLAKLQAASNQMAAAAKSAEAATNGAPGKPVAAIDPNTLQGFLPTGLSGVPRSNLSSESGGAAGLGASHVEASYGSGANTIKLSVTDMGAAGAFAALGSAFNVQSASQDSHGYEKMGKVDGRMTTEKWNNDSRSGTYSVLVADRFMVSADGEGTSIDALKAAVGQVNFGGLEQLAKS
jgi:hypothetical protein